MDPCFFYRPRTCRKMAKIAITSSTKVTGVPLGSTADNMGYATPKFRIAFAWIPLTTEVWQVTCTGSAAITSSIFHLHELCSPHATWYQICAGFQLTYILFNKVLFDFELPSDSLRSHFDFKTNKKRACLIRKNAHLGMTNRTSIAHG